MNDTIGCTHCGFKNVPTYGFSCMGQCGAFLCEKCLREGLEKLQAHKKFMAEGVYETKKVEIDELVSLLTFVADAYYRLSNPRSHDFCDGCGRASSLGPPYHEPDCIVLRVQDVLAKVKNK